MATNFPTSLDALTNPTGTDTLASPDHAGQHADANDAIEALQAKVGVNSSAVTTSLDYKVAQKIDKTLVDAKGDLIVASAADTVGRLAVGATNGHVLTVDSAESLGVKWAAAITPTLAYISGEYYRTPVAISTRTATVNQLYFAPLLVHTSTTLDRITITTASSFSGTAVVRLGLYAESNGRPGSLIVDAGTVSCTASTTQYEITINATVGPGFFFVGAVMQTAATTSTFFGINGSGSYNPWLNSWYNNASTGSNAGFYKNSVTGSLPNPAADSGYVGSVGILASVRKT